VHASVVLCPPCLRLLKTKRFILAHTSPSDSCNLPARRVCAGCERAAPTGQSASDIGGKAFGGWNAPGRLKPALRSWTRPLYSRQGSPGTRRTCRHGPPGAGRSQAAVNRRSVPRAFGVRPRRHYRANPRGIDAGDLSIDGRSVSARGAPVVSCRPPQVLSAATGTQIPTAGQAVR
jgi:hypothetical protein